MQGAWNSKYVSFFFQMVRQTVRMRFVLPTRFNFALVRAGRYRRVRHEGNDLYRHEHDGLSASVRSSWYAPCVLLLACDVAPNEEDPAVMVSPRKLLAADPESQTWFGWSDTA